MLRSRRLRRCAVVLCLAAVAVAVCLPGVMGADAIVLTPDWILLPTLVPQQVVIPAAAPAERLLSLRALVAPRAPPALSAFA